MTRKTIVALAFVASVATVNISQAAPVMANPSAIKAAASNGITNIQWQVWAGRPAWAGAGALAYRAWERYHYNYGPYGYGPYGYGLRYGYYRYYGPPRYYYGGW
jgi:hypothetical protein